MVEELGLSGVGANMVTVGPGGPQPGMGILAMMASIGAVPGAGAPPPYPQLGAGAPPPHPHLQPGAPPPHQHQHQTTHGIFSLYKGTVSVCSSDPSRKEGNIKLTVQPLKPMTVHKRQGT